jgi:hypothetical protein
METLEKLEYFSKKHAELFEANRLLQEEAKKVEKEWQDWVETRLMDSSMTGNMHISSLMKSMLEKNLEIPKT